MATDVMALHRRYNALRADRDMWESAWADLAAHFLPTRWRKDSDTQSAKKPVLNTGLADSTGILDMRTLAAGMQGGMTSPVRPWFKLEFQDDSLNAVHDAGVWLDELTRRMQAALHNSNFYNAIHTLYADVGTFGTGCLIETADAYGLKFQVLRAGEYCVDISKDNLVDTLFTRHYLTARQIIQDFGEDKSPEVVKTCVNAGRGLAETQRFDVIQAIYPREDIAGSPKGKPFASVWYMYQGNGNGKPVLLRESGFESFPAFVPRWDVSGSDVYGRSPAMDVLSDCRMLQSMTRTLLKAMHRIVDPPMSIDARLRSIGLDMRPNGANYVDWSGTGNPVAAAPIMQTDPASVQVGMQARMETQKAIHDGLYSDLFKMLIADDRRQITATEIQAREQEKLVLVGPVVERLHKELYQPLIERTYELMRQWGYIPEAPAGLEDAAIKIDFVSVLAQAQRLVSTSTIDQTMAFAAQVGQMMPEVLDSIDPDKLMDTYTDALGVSKGILRGKDDRDKMRAERAEQQAQMQQQAQQAQGVQNLQGMAGAAKSLGETPSGADGQTALEALIGGMGGM